MRRTDIQRDSRPASHQLFSNLEEKATLEARNGLLQFDEVLNLIDQSKNGFRLRPSTIQRLQRLAIQDVYTCAGNYRTGPVYIEGTTHQPPAAHEVAERVEEMVRVRQLQLRPIGPPFGCLRDVATELDSSVLRRQRPYLTGGIISGSLCKTGLSRVRYKNNPRTNCCQPPALL